MTDIPSPTRLYSISISNQKAEFSISNFTTVLTSIIRISGYADSSPVMPTKTGVVQDALKVFDYVKEHVGNSETRVIVYGHSLGTAVSCEAVNRLCVEGNPPDALVLESPFNNIHDEVHWLLTLWMLILIFFFLFRTNFS